MTIAAQNRQMFEQHMIEARNRLANVVKDTSKDEVTPERIAELLDVRVPPVEFYSSIIKQSFDVQQAIGALLSRAHMLDATLAVQMHNRRLLVAALGLNPEDETITIDHVLDRISELRQKEAVSDALAATTPAGSH